MSERVESLLQQMTLEEKISLLAGFDMWHTMSIERLGIPKLKVTDGPNGARGAGSFTNAKKAACFPAEILLASTWDTELVNRVGKALGQETKAKGAQILLAPTVNIHRSPLNGRNFESFSEDPYLSARLAVSYITGVQSEGVGTAVKHFVCNDSEYQRESISSEVTERPLREIYLPAFLDAICEAKSWMIMVAYNRINGIDAAEHTYLLKDILRGEWEFDGVVVSDWFVSVRSTAPAVNASTDLEMPGPGFWRGDKLLLAVQRGYVAEATVEDSARRILQLIEKAGLFENPMPAEEQELDLPEHRALIREAAADGMVLLKNRDNLLPLQRDTLQSIAVIGPNAKVARIMAGGSAEVRAHYAVTPYDGLVNKVGDKITLNYAIGCTNHKRLPLFDIEHLYAGTTGNEHGFKAEYFDNGECAGQALDSEIIALSEIQWGQKPTAVADAKQISVRLTARYYPPTSGSYTFSLASVGVSRLFVNGQLLVDNWTKQTRGDYFFNSGSTEVKGLVELTKEQPHTITIEYSNGSHNLTALRIGCFAPLPENALDHAVAVAASSDVAIVFAGLSGEWESESFDRPNMDLVGEQNLLISQVAAANKNTIVVLNTGSPTTMPWLEPVGAVLQAWFPGQECGNAIADVLFGDVNPSGKLPQTFPVRLEDNPAFINYPGENGKVYYGEGIYVGYRYYEKKKIAPLFPFGYGLSYTTFAYGPLQLSQSEMTPEEKITVSLAVTNTGNRKGKEIVQLYIRDLESHLHRPLKELKGFAKVELEPGESKTVTLSIDRDSLSYYDDLSAYWTAEAGEFEVLVGSSSQDIHGSARFRLNRTSYYRKTQHS